MSIYLAIPFILGNAALALRRPRLGVLVYAGLALLSPHPSLMGMPVAYEILALPAVLLAVLIVRPRFDHPGFHLVLALFLALLIFSSIVGTTVHGTEFDAIRFQGLLRFLVVLALFRELLDRRGIEDLVLVVIAANAAIGFAQLLLPGSAQWTYDLYGRAGQAVLEGYSLADAIPRASGSFSSPVILGSVALLALAMAWARMLEGSPERRYRWVLVAAGLAGIASLTKTFLLGAPIVLLGGLALAPFVGGTRAFRFHPRTLLLGSGAVLAAIGLVVWAVGYFEGIGLNVGYYLGYLTDPTEAFATRYGPAGQLAATMGVIRDNPLIGVGVTKVQGEFLGDSSYILLLHTTGALGVVLALAALAFIVRWTVGVRRHLDLLVLGALLVAGLALPFVFSLPGALAISYLLRAPEPLAAGEPVAQVP